MAREFRYPLTDEIDITVEQDGSGELYVERGTASRVAWMLMGLFAVGVATLYVVQYDGSEGWLLATATPSAIAGVALLGVVAEPMFGSERSAVVETGGTYYVEMMVSSRVYVAAAAVAVLTAGVSMFLSVRAPAGIESVGRRRGVVSVAEALPFGEYVLLAAAVLVSLWLFNKARTGWMRIRPT